MTNIRFVCRILDCSSKLELGVEIPCTNATKKSWLFQTLFGGAIMTATIYKIDDNNYYKIIGYVQYNTYLYGRTSGGDVYQDGRRIGITYEGPQGPDEG